MRRADGASPLREPLPESDAGQPSKIQDFVRQFHLLVEKLHIRQLDVFAFIHTVDGQAFASGDENAFAQGKEFGLFRDREGFRVSGVKVHGGSVQKNGHILTFGEKKIAEPDRIPFDFGISARKHEKYLYFRSFWRVSIEIIYANMPVKAGDGESPQASAGLRASRQLLRLDRLFAADEGNGQQPGE